MSLEMSQQRELATGARECDAKPRHEKAGKTPPISLTGQSIKCEIGRVVPADHEAPGQQTATAAGVRSRRRATRNSREGIGLANQATSTAEQGHGARSRRHRADVGLEALRNKASQQREWCPQGCAPVPRTGEQAHGLQEVSSHPHAACGEGKSSVERARVPTHSVWKTRKAL